MSIQVTYPWLSTITDDATVQRAGSKHSSSDMKLIQEGHNLFNQLGAQCEIRMPWSTPRPVTMPTKALTERAGARHTKAEMAQIQRLHDLSCELGADCPGKKMMGDGDMGMTGEEGY